MNNLPKMITDIDNSALAKIDVVCFGHFNVLHPGHFRFLNFAAGKGKELCVILSDDIDFTYAEKQYYFSIQERSEALRNIGIVKHVITKGHLDLAYCLDIIKPKFFILGHEYERGRNFEHRNAIKKSKELGIKVIYHSGDQNLSSNFSIANRTLDNGFNDYSKRKFQQVCERRNIDLSRIAKKIKVARKIRSLVIGDLIVDDFVSSQPLGLSSEAPVVVVKELSKQSYIGGAGIVACNVAQLSAETHFLSVAGDDHSLKFAKSILQQFNVKSKIFIDENRPTTTKTRFIAGSQKLFRSSRLMDTDISTGMEDFLINEIENLGPLIDNIIVSDFVYGVITPRLISKIYEISQRFEINLYGDLQCSSQVGSILKLKDFDVIFPTEREARVALNNKDDGLEYISRQLFERAHCKNLILKLGSDGLIAYFKRDNGFIESEHFPALNQTPIDVSGAGDSVLAFISSAKTAGMSLFEASALGSVAAAVSVERMGNLPIDIDLVSEKLESLSIF